MELSRAPARASARAVAPGLASRQAALEVIERVTDRGDLLDDALEAVPAMPAQDRAFVRALTATCLRRLGQIDDALSRLMQRRPPAKARRVIQILRLGAAQTLFMAVPAHAAVDSAVRLAKADPVALHFAPLINAVLRRLGEQSEAILASQDAAALNVPQWLLARWSKAYGAETARAIAATFLVEPPLDLSVKSDPEAWAARFGGIVLPTGTVRLVPEGPIEQLDGFAEGEWWVQDAAAALPARLLGPVAGRRVADLCAAPGGKTAALAAAGGQVTAVDRSPARLARLRANLARLALEAEIVVADIRQWQPDEAFDAVLIDAPCMATGTARRHPDILTNKSAADLAALTILQGELLARAPDLVKPGGTLVYCTCSLEPEEGEAQAARLAQAGAFRRVPIEPAEIGAASDWIDADGCLRTLPCHFSGPSPRLSGLDGFFAARFERI